MTTQCARRVEAGGRPTTVPTTERHPMTDTTPTPADRPADLLPDQLDLFDEGGCGCFTDALAA